METVYRDYAPKGVHFYYIYKALSHPELDGYVTPYTLEERLMHVREAERRLGSKIPWICDLMSNEIKHALGNRNNSEFVADADGKIVRMRPWSNPDALRKDLEALVGPVEKPTQVSDLKMEKLPPPSRPAAKGVVPRVQAPGPMDPIKVVPVVEKTPFYAKLRAEIEPSVLMNGSGRMYLGFHLDPLYRVHWNNLVDPLHFEIKATGDAGVSPASGSGPRVAAESDIDPREFLVEVQNVDRNDSLDLTVRYFACTDEWCRPVTQKYRIHFERDSDAGRVLRRGAPRGLLSEGPGFGPGRVPPPIRAFDEALADLKLTEDQRSRVEAIRDGWEDEVRDFPRMVRESGMNPEEARGSRRDLLDGMLAKLKEVLNAEQYAQFSKTFQRF